MNNYQFGSIGDFKALWQSSVSVSGTQPTGVATLVSGIAERTFAEAETVFNGDYDVATEAGRCARNGRLYSILGNALSEVSGLYSAQSQAA